MRQFLPTGTTTGCDVRTGDGDLKHYFASSPSTFGASSIVKYCIVPVDGEK